MPSIYPGARYDTLLYPPGSFLSQDPNSDSDMFQEENYNMSSLPYPQAGPCTDEYEQMEANGD